MSFRLEVGDIDRLVAAMEACADGVEAKINEVLHNEGSQLIQDSIRELMPRSNVKAWNGKLPHAKDNKKSLRDKKENLSITVRASGAPDYQYLYFPDDGYTTDNHAGKQYFFARGGEAVKDDIIDRCIAKLTENF